MSPTQTRARRLEVTRAIVCACALVVALLAVAACGDSDECHPPTFVDVADGSVDAARLDGGRLDCAALCTRPPLVVSGCGESVDDAGAPIILCAYYWPCR